jgi:hypothetical protein
MSAPVVTKGFKWFIRGNNGVLLGKNGFIYKEGHVSILENDGALAPCGNGLHFCKVAKDVFKYITENDPLKVAIRHIEAFDEIVDDEYDTKSVCRALKVLGPMVMTPDLWVAALCEINPKVIKCIPPAENTAELRLAAVKGNGLVIQLLSRAAPTAEVCLAAVTQNGGVIHFLSPEERTAEVCLAAVTQRGDAIEYLTAKERTAELCLAAVTKDGCAIQFLSPEQRTPEVCLAAVTEYGLAINILSPDQRTPEVCLAAVSQNEDAIKHLNSEERCAIGK